MTAAELLIGGTVTLDTTERAGRVHQEIPGGSALYAAAGASLAMPCRLVGIAGTDFPFDSLGPLWERGVDRALLDVRPGPTFRWHARYDPAGNDRVTLSRHPGVAGGRFPAVPAASHPRAVHLGSMDPAAQSHILDASPCRVLTSVDSMRHWWSERPRDVRAVLARANLLFLSEDELSIATGGHGVTDAASLLEAGPATVVVKRGASGAWLLRRDTPPMAIDTSRVLQVRDTTGAGDAFGGAYIARRIAGADDLTALRFATAVASFAIEGLGLDGLLNATPAAVEVRAAALRVVAL